MSFCICCSYKFRDRSELGPKTLPVCETFEKATKQYNSANLKRLTNIVHSQQAVAKFGQEEAERRALEATEEYEQEDEKAKQEEMDLEVSCCVDEIV